jgi:hypothetical protein
MAAASRLAELVETIAHLDDEALPVAARQEGLCPSA